MESHEIQSGDIYGNNTGKIGRLSILSALSRLPMSFNMIVLPLYALALGYDESFYGILVAAAGYVQAAILFPAGTFSDRRGRGTAILVGGILAGAPYFSLPFVADSITILTLYALTGIGAAFTRTSIDSLIADYTKKGTERTRSYGYTITFATLAAVVGPFLGGFILDPITLPGISEEMIRYAILFVIIGGIHVSTGVIGISTERWLGEYYPIVNEKEPAVEEVVDESRSTQDTRTALLFGLSQLIVGFSSGMVIPYFIPWIYAAFDPDPVVLGSIPAIANLTLASGTLLVGLSSERIGKLKMIFVLNLLAPILTFGIVYIPYFLIMIVFYIARQTVANMSRPAFNSLFMGEITTSRRGRSLALTRVMWQFPRQTGTLTTAFILGFFGGIVPFGLIVFPIAMIMYPISTIPLYIAVRRNRIQKEQIQYIPADL
ncbi:MAG: MFS transporter [Candidatus Thorarchaeota archaeon]|jgi:MFS family permease